MIPSEEWPHKFSVPGITVKKKTCGAPQALLPESSSAINLSRIFPREEGNGTKFGSSGLSGVDVKQTNK